MKVEVLFRSDERIEDLDWRDAVEVKINDERVFFVVDGESEDNNLLRNFNDVFRISMMLQQVYEAGKQGEVLDLTEGPSDEI